MKDHFCADTKKKILFFVILSIVTLVTDRNLFAQTSGMEGEVENPVKASSLSNTKYNFIISTLKEKTVSVNNIPSRQDVSPSIANISVGNQAVLGMEVINPTSLQFGPDNRLYVSQQNGLIKALTIVRNGPNNYQTTATEIIGLINSIPNHNDDGSLAPTVTTRQVTGILLAGTAANPVLYVSSSDSRIGGPNGDKNLDTNSGIISCLTKTSTGWDKIDLVRGLPRSEENHANNGLQLNPATNMLYVASGGFTNAGAPSNNFAFITEYALAAAILSVDLNVINAMPIKGTGNNKYKYDLPTVDDPTRINNSVGADPNDPFGGNDGLNQAKIVEGGPVQIYSPGYRNAYDLVIMKTLGKAGRMYTIDNGANQGWGGHPHNEGANGTVTNNYVVNEPGSTQAGPHDPRVNNLDNLHYIGNVNTYTPGSYYGGHPVPIRANPAGAGLYTHNGSGIWRTSKTGDNPLPADWPPLPLNKANPVEGDYQNPGETDNAILTFSASTNGIAEYTGSGFNNSLKGHLLAAGYNGDIYDIVLNEAGADVLNQKGPSKLNLSISFASGFGSQPLDITTQGDNDIFPGTIWAATYGNGAITVFEPQELVNCTGIYNALDDDTDGFTNADETDNNTNPCSAASRPLDFNGNLISDLNDPDDDADNIEDNADFFALDVNNGVGRLLPVKYDLFNNDPGTGLFGLGFTGLMNSQKPDNNYHKQFNGNNLIAGGAVGAFSVVAVSGGDALGTLNSQENAFQYGLDVNSGTGPFTVKSRMLSPFFDNKTPQNNQSQGIYIGTGDQSNYLKIVLNVNGGTPGILVVFENADVATSYQHSLDGLPTQSIDLYLAVNPATGVIQPKYSKDGGAVLNAGSSITVSGKLLTALQGSPALAVGVISTSRFAQPFTATWDYIYVTNDVVTATGMWQGIVASSGAPIPRHEASYVQAGDKFYLLGGRRIDPVQIYNPTAKTWTNAAAPPIELNHFQAVTLNGLIYIVGAHTGAYPGETPVPDIYIYNPVKNTWLKGAQIPVARRRGSAGVVTYNNKIYVVSGITNGHLSGHVTWLDEYDPYTNTWTVLPNAPRPRDHFHAAVYEGKLYAVGGRRTSTSTGQTFALTVPEVDVFDFATKTWSTLPNNIPTQRAASAVGILGDELIIAGGESGTQETAHNDTEALNLKTNTWRPLAKMIQGRHGTQGIINNNGIYVAAGSGGRGGGPELGTQEAFFMFSPTTPGGIPLSESNLSPSTTNLGIGQVTIGSSKASTVILTNTSGNQGIILTSINIAHTTDFKLSLPYTMPVLLAPGQTLNIGVTFTPISSGVKTSTIQVQHSGSNATVEISVTGEGGIATPQSSYLINSGGPSMVVEGKTWVADQYFTAETKTASNNAIADIGNTTNDILYKTERTSSNKLMGYAIPVSQACNYLVNLHFAEIYWGATGKPAGSVGKRIFSVNLEGGATELSNFDIYAEVGSMKAVIKSYTIAVSDGVLNIDFIATVDQAKISAIEIIHVPGGGTTQTPYSINTGGSSVVLGEKTWTADQYFTSATRTTSNNAIVDIANTTNDIVYKTERISSNKLMGYAIPVSQAGSYMVNLHFAEIYWGATGKPAGSAGKRIFSVNLEGGATELTNFDIYAEVGAMKAVIKTYTIAVSDGVLNIDFIASVDQAKISAIEVIPVSSGPSLTATPASLHFFSQQTGTTSPGQSIGLINTGNSSINVSGVSITGADNTQFTHNYTTTVIPGGASSSISIAFKPASLGTKVAQLNIIHSGSNSPLIVGLTGEGINNTPIQSVESFTIINADTEQPIRNLVNGESISMATLQTNNINIRANTNPSTVGSVLFNLTGAQTKAFTDPVAPYALYDDISGNYNPWTPAVGNYTLTATPYSSSGGTGTKGNALTLSFSVTNTSASCSSTGTILREHWANVSGNLVSLIPVNTTPTSTSQLTSFESPSNIGDQYGARVRGYLCVPTTGSYTFYIASDDMSELWLSTNNMPANKRLIAKVTAYTSYRQWTKFPSQKSVGIAMQAGVKYYIEALHKEGGSGDQLSVGWILPNTSIIDVIPGTYLSPFVPSAGAKIGTELAIEDNGLLLFPNPSSGDFLKIEASGLDAEEELTFHLFSTVGIETSCQSFKADGTGKINATINFTKQLSQGIYSGFLENKRRRIYKKIQVIR